MLLHVKILNTYLVVDSFVVFSINRSFVDWLAVDLTVRSVAGSSSSNDEECNQEKCKNLHVDSFILK